MPLYKQGDIVNRFGTVGVSRVPENGLFVVLAVNNGDRFGESQLYTCAPIWSDTATSPGFISTETIGGAKITVDLSRMLVASEKCITPSNPGSDALKTTLGDKGLRILREGLKTKFFIDGADVGRIVTTVSPSDGGERGKVNRPYAILATLGKGTGDFLAVPISSSKGMINSGVKVEDLAGAHLNRENGEESFFRFGLLQAVNLRTSTLTKGRLTEMDRSLLVKTGKFIRDSLIEGKVNKLALESNELRRPSVDIGVLKQATPSLHR